MEILTIFLSTACLETESVLVISLKI